MLRITVQTDGGEVVLRLEGSLAGPWVDELDTCWRRASSDNRPMRVDLTSLCQVDAAGRDLLSVMYRAGAQFVTKGCVMPEVVREISTCPPAGLRGEALPEPSAKETCSR
jgi:ABC-type transporter Mla MlaB component